MLRSVSLDDMSFLKSVLFGAPPELGYRFSKQYPRDPRNALGTRSGALEHASHDDYCMPDVDPFPMLLKRLDGIQAIRQKFFHNLRHVKPGPCWSTIAESSLEC